jgi:UDP-galactopyranose mutase
MPIIDGKEILSRQDIPIVSNQTINAMYQVYAGKKWGIHLSEVRENLMRDNPNLVKFIESQVGKYPRELHNAMFEIVMGTIAVLRLQGMLDEKQRENGNK